MLSDGSGENSRGVLDLSEASVKLVKLAELSSIGLDHVYSSPLKRKLSCQDDDDENEDDEATNGSFESGSMCSKSTTVVSLAKTSTTANGKKKRPFLGAFFLKKETLNEQQ